MLNQIWRRNWRFMLLTYAVLTFEASLNACWPWITGQAIDGLIAGQYGWFFLYTGLCVTGLLVGVGRRMADTRVFGWAWREVTVQTVRDLMDAEVEPAKVITRASLSTRFVDFFEYYLPQFLYVVSDLVVGSVMLHLAVPGIAWFSVPCFAVAVAWSWKASGKGQEQDRLANDATDRSNAAIQRHDGDAVDVAYRERVRCYIKSSDWQSWGWGGNDLFGTLVYVATMLLLVKRGATPGVIVATLMYADKLFRGVQGLHCAYINWKGVQVAKEKIGEALEKSKPPAM